MRLLKRLSAFVLAGVLLSTQAIAAADQKPRDPSKPYASSVTGMFHEQDTGSEASPGQYTVFLPESLEQCAPGVMIAVPDQTTAEAFSESEVGRQWQAVCEKFGIAAVFVEPLNGGTWNLSGDAGLRDEAAYLKQVSDNFHSKSKTRDAAFNLNERAFYAVGYEEGGAAIHEFAMKWPQMLAGAASVGGSDVPDEMITELGDALSYPFAQAGSMEGQRENNLPNKDIPVPMWIVESGNASDNSAAVLDYWIAADDAVEQDANDYAQAVYANECARVWVTNAAQADQITPEVLYVAFLSGVQRFVGDPGGRLEWTVSHTNNGETGFFYSEEVVEGNIRRWFTYVPSSYEPGTEVPLVVAIHGYSSSIYAFTGDSRWQDVAEENGFIVVFPQAYVNDFPSRGEVFAPVWHTYSYALTETATDDVEFIRQLIGITEDRYSIDDTRIYATGHSNGATMTWALGLDAAELFAAIAPVGHNSGSYRGAPGNNNMGPTDRLSDTTPAQECDEILPVWMFKGVYDVDGGATFDNLHLWNTNSNAEALAHWTARNGADPSAPAESVDASGRYVTETYTADTSDAPLVRYTVVENSPHAYIPTEAEMIWDNFFSKYSREDGVLYYEGRPVNVTPQDDKVSFTDISGHWAEEAIVATVESGLFSGTSATEFSPEEYVNRGMAITVIGRSALAVGAPVYASEKFTDVAYSDYFAPYVGWAVQNGIAQGTGANIFEPAVTITREELAVMLSNYIDKEGVTAPDTNAPTEYADAASISSWAAEAVNTMQTSGLMTGKDNNCFDSQGILTRAELAVVMQRIAAL